MTFLVDRFKGPRRTYADGELPDRTVITQMFRNGRQLAVLSRLLRGEQQPSCRIAIHGVADGAEAVSLLIALAPAASPLELRIEGYDLRPEYLEIAKTLSFPADHFAPGYSPSAYPEYLERRGRNWHLRAKWRECLTFAACNVLQAGTVTPPGSCDAVVCQNVLVTLSADDCRAAIRALAAAVRPGGLLVLGGGPLDSIARLAAGEGCFAVLDDVEGIHEGWTIQRRFYGYQKRPGWALEPFDAAHADGPQRYATIFKKTGR